MTAVLTALQAHQQIEEFANNAPTEMRFIPDGTMTPGKWIRQGDIYLQALEEIPPAYDKEIFERQLAPGESRGSRHVIEGNVKLFIPSKPGNRNDVLVGPVIVSKERCVLTHPEHAHFSLPAGVISQVYYQMDARQAERTRARD